jgi:predicted ester cyclase
LVQRLFYEDLSTHDDHVAGEIFHPDFFDHTNPPGMQHGIKGHKAIVDLFRGTFPDMRWEIHDLIAAGDRVVARTTMTGVQRGEFFGIAATGRPVEVGGVHILRIADGRIIEHWGNNDDLGMMRQLGVIPPS